MLVQTLPNGSIVLTLTAREATLVMDEMLPPDTFPWQSAESQMVATEMKMLLRQQIEMQIARGLGFVVEGVQYHAAKNQEQQDDDDGDDDA